MQENITVRDVNGADLPQAGTAPNVNLCLGSTESTAPAAGSLATGRAVNEPRSRGPTRNVEHPGPGGPLHQL